MDNVDERVMSRAARRKVGIRMKRLAKSASFKKKKERAMKRMPTADKIKKLSRKAALKKLRTKYFPKYLNVYDSLVDISWEDFCGGHYIDLELKNKDISYYAKNDGHPNDKGNKEWFEYLLKEIK